MIVTGLTLVGGAYKRGHWHPGWSVLTFEDGSTHIIPDGDKVPKGMVGPLDMADVMGHDTKEYRERLAEWVKTGKMPAPPKFSAGWPKVLSNPFPEN